MADPVGVRYNIGTQRGSFNTADPSTWGLTPLQFAQNTAKLNPQLHMSDADVQQMADQTAAQWNAPGHQAGTAFGTPVLDLGATAGDQSIGNVNTWMRAQPWYQQLTSSWGKTGGFTDQEKAQLLQAAQANGVNVSNKDIQLDENGNFRNTNTGWKQAGQIAATAAPIVAAPFTGGATLALIGAGSGALSGALGDGGVKGALTGAALGAMPGIGKMAGGAIANQAGQTALRAGLGAARGGLSGGGVTGALTGAGAGALTGAGGATNQIANPLERQLVQTGLGAARGAIQGGGSGALGGAVSSVQPNVFNSVLPSGGGGGMGVNWQNLINAGLGAAQGGMQGGGWSGAALGGANAYLRGGQQPQGGGQTPMMSLVNGGGGGVFGTGGGPSYTFGFADSGGNPIPGTGPVDATDSGGDNSTEGQDPSYGQQPLPSWNPNFGGGATASYSGGSAPLPSAGSQVRYTPPTLQNPGGGGGGAGGAQQSGWQKWGPLAVQGGAALGGILAARQAQNAAMQRSPEETAALQQAQQTMQQTGQNANALYGQGQSYLQPAANYYQALLSGNRAAMSQAVAPQIASATDVYRGAQRGLEQSGIRGAQKQVALGDLNRQRAAQIAGLTTGVQPAAASALGQMGQNVMNQAPNYYQLAGGLGQNLLNQGFYNRAYAQNVGTQAGQQIGGFIRDIGNAIPGSQTPYRGVTAPPAGQAGTASQAMTPPGQKPINPYSAMPQS